MLWNCVPYITLPLWARSWTLPGQRAFPRARSPRLPGSPRPPWSKSRETPFPCPVWLGSRSLSIRKSRSAKQGPAVLWIIKTFSLYRISAVQVFFILFKWCIFQKINCANIFVLKLWDNFYKYFYVRSFFLLSIEIHFILWYSVLALGVFITAAVKAAGKKLS